LSSVEGSTHFQKAVEILQDSYPKIALRWSQRSRWG
jgi:hypothetical protein